MSDPRFKDRPLSTDVTPEQQRQLVRVMEEAAEVSIAAAKILRFGPLNWHPASVTKETNTAAFRREWDDLLEAVTDLGEGHADPLPRPEDAQRAMYVQRATEREL